MTEGRGQTTGARRIDFALGQDLQRPECILAEPDGSQWSAGTRGGVVRISAYGSQ